MERFAMRLAVLLDVLLKTFAVLAVIAAAIALLGCAPSVADINEEVEPIYERQQLRDNTLEIEVDEELWWCVKASSLEGYE